MSPKPIIIFRHAEKPTNEGDPNLSPLGQERAAMLAKTLPKRFPTIGRLFAASSSNHSNRPVETITPLANVLGLAFNAKFADLDYAALANHLIQKGEYQDTCVVICWHHGHIPQLALALGVSHTDLENAPGMVNGRWDDAVFDRLWILTFEKDAVQFSTELEGAI